MDVDQDSLGLWVQENGGTNGIEGDGHASIG
jgi:hypothetical protein